MPTASPQPQENQMAQLTLKNDQITVGVLALWRDLQGCGG
jgi:hypothetical protein